MTESHKKRASTQTELLLSPVVLSNEHSRAIYDIFGKKGLEVEGWEVFISLT